MNYGTPTRGAPAGRDAPTYFGRSVTPAAEGRGGASVRGQAPAANAGVGESMFSSTTPAGYANSGGFFGAENRQYNAEDQHRADGAYLPRTPGKNMSSYMDFGDEDQNRQMQPYQSTSPGAAEGMRGSSALALVGNTDGSDDDDMLMPPSNSLLSGMAATPAAVDRVRQEAANEASGLRRRQLIRTPGTGQVGLDLDAPRGLDLSSPLVLASRTRAGSGADALVGPAAGQSSWVTVFGYPTGAGFAVLRHFQNYGEVHEHRNEAGNWMHILYSSRVQASRALAQNGHFITVGDSQVMIGVKPCSDPRIASMAASAASAQGMTSKSFTHQAKQSYRVREPEQLQRAPSRAKSVCKRFWAWVLDV